jgi:hypothetical protein
MIFFWNIRKAIYIVLYCVVCQYPASEWGKKKKIHSKWKWERTYNSSFIKRSENSFVIQIEHAFLCFLHLSNRWDINSIFLFFIFIDSYGKNVLRETLSHWMTIKAQRIHFPNGKMLKIFLYGFKVIIKKCLYALAIE